MKLLSVTIPVIWLMIFSVAADIDTENKYDYKTELNKALNLRTELLNQAYCDGKKVENGLKTVLTDPLLKNDIENIECTENTEVEPVMGFEIVEYELLDENHEGAVVRAVIRWDMNASEQPVNFIGDEYTIVFQHSADGTLKMSEMNHEYEKYR